MCADVDAVDCVFDVFDVAEVVHVDAVVPVVAAVDAADVAAFASADVAGDAAVTDVSAAVVADDAAVALILEGARFMLRRHPGAYRQTQEGDARTPSGRPRFGKGRARGAGIRGAPIYRLVYTRP